jgi:hypothetical protein
MTPLAVFGPSALGVAVFALAASPAVATSNAAPIPKSCPSASVVNTALGQQDRTAVATTTAYARICTYKGTGILPTKITFQEDTSATFAAGEKAAAAAVPVVKVKGLGKSAWGPKVGGGLYVFVGAYSIRILSPLTSTAKLEVLARKLL